MDVWGSFLIGLITGACAMAVLLVSPRLKDKPVSPTPRPELTAAEIVAKKRPQSLRLRKSIGQQRAEFEAKHNLKQQRHERLVQEIEHVASREVDVRVEP